MESCTGMLRSRTKDHEAEDQAEGADDETAQQEVVAADAAQKGGGTEVGELQVGFTAGLFLRHQRCRGKETPCHQDDESKKYAGN